jgi:hypothetical protein
MKNTGKSVQCEVMSKTTRRRKMSKHTQKIRREVARQLREAKEAHRASNREKTIHHRLPISRGGSDTFPRGNTIEVCRSKHQAWHTLFDSWPLERVVVELNNVYIDPRFRLVIQRR